MDIDKDLFEDMSTMYMEEYGLTPLTANIYTLLFFDYQHQGITFDELIEATNASKSSVSNALNRLLQNNCIEYFTKIEERKRYYRINKSIFKVNFLNKIHKIKMEHKILKRFAVHRSHIIDNDDEESQKLQLHIQLQENIIKLYEDTLNSLNQTLK